MVGHGPQPECRPLARRRWHEERLPAADHHLDDDDLDDDDDVDDLDDDDDDRAADGGDAGAVAVSQSRCADGVVTVPSVTSPANGGGITYTMVPAVPKAGDSVTVTAVLADWVQVGEPVADAVDGG